MTTPYYARGEPGKAYMTVATGVVTPAIGGQISVVVDSTDIAGAGDELAFKGVPGRFTVDAVQGDGVTLLVTNDSAASGTSIAAGTKLFIAFPREAEDPVVATPAFDTPSMDEGEITVTWSTDVIPAFVDVRFHPSGNVGAAVMRSTAGTDGVVKYNPPWTGATVVTGWGRASTGETTDAVAVGTISAAIPQPTGATAVSSAAGTLTIGWTPVVYNTRVFVRRVGDDDYKQIDVGPTDEGGNVINSLTVTGLLAGDYTVGIYHFTTGFGQWSEGRFLTNSGAGYAVVGAPVGDDTQEVLEAGLSLASGGLEFTGSEGFVRFNLTGFSSAPADATGGFFLGKVGGNYGLVIGNNTNYMRYSQTAGTLTLVGGTIQSSDLAGGTITIGAGLNEFKVTDAVLQYGGSSGLVVDKETIGGIDLVSLKLNDGGVLIRSWVDSGDVKSSLNLDCGSVLGQLTINGALDTALFTIATASAEATLDLTAAQSILNLVHGTLAGVVVNGTLVLTDRQTGWTVTKHGTPARNVDLSAGGLTLAQVAQVLSALIDDLGTSGHGLIDQA